MITQTDIIKQTIAEITAVYPGNDQNDTWAKCNQLQPPLAARAQYLERQYGDFADVVKLSLAGYFLSFLTLFFHKKGTVKAEDILKIEALEDLIGYLGKIILSKDTQYRSLPNAEPFDCTIFLNLWLNGTATFSARQAKDNIILDLLILHDQENGTRLSSRLLNDIRYIIYSLAIEDSSLSFTERELLDFLESESKKVRELINDNDIIDLDKYGQQFENRQAEALLAEAKNELDELIGLAAIKHEIRRLEAFLSIQKIREKMDLAVTGLTLHFVFCGNPGTGKTTVARILGKLFKGIGFLSKGHVEETDRSGLVAEYLGQTATKTHARAKAALDGILFIDEAYALSRNNSGGSGNDSYGREAIETVLKFMEDNRKRIVVIVAGYPKLMTEFIDSNPGLKSRFTRYLDFEDFNPNELCQIIHLFAEKAQYHFSKKALIRLNSILNAAFQQRGAGFGNARFVRNLFEETLQNQAVRLSEIKEQPSKNRLMRLELEDLPLTIDDVTFSAEESVEGHLNCGNCTRCSDSIAGEGEES